MTTGFISEHDAKLAFAARRRFLPDDHRVEDRRIPNAVRATGTGRREPDAERHVDEMSAVAAEAVEAAAYVAKMMPIPVSRSEALCAPSRRRKTNTTRTAAEVPHGRGTRDGGTTAQGGLGAGAAAGRSSEGNGREPAGAATPPAGTVEGQQRRIMRLCLPVTWLPAPQALDAARTAETRTETAAETVAEQCRIITERLPAAAAQS